MPFVFTEQEIPGLVLVQPKVFRDERGHFLESFSRTGFASAGLPTEWVQENHSRSIRGVLRGLHFQRPPKAQAKLVRVTSGEIYDVAVDLRPDSPNCGKWVSVVLSAENHLQLYIPAGFAHGFCVLSETAEVSYLVTDDYSPAHEDGIIWNDPGLAIEWPVENPIVAERDQKWPCFAPFSAVAR
jgi:dTDP-4-dehydrorhamnose 3,5-epimerase